MRVSLGTKDVAIARALRDFIMEATPKIAARIPQRPPKHMPDIRENREVVRRPEPFRQTRRGAANRPRKIRTTLGPSLQENELHR